MISIDTIAKLFDRDRRPNFLERVFLPQDLWKRIHDSPVHSGVSAEKATIDEPESDDEQQEPSVAARDSMDFLPLESRKSVVTKDAQDEPGRLSGLAQEINSVKQELTSMRRRIDELARVHRQVDSLQTALLQLQAPQLQVLIPRLLRLMFSMALMTLVAR